MVRWLGSALVALTFVPSLAAGELPLLRLDSLAPDAARLVATAEDDAPGRYRIVQYARPPGEVERRRLEELGTVLGYLPDHAYLLRLGDDTSGLVAGSVGAVWSGAWVPELKISRSVGALDGATPARERWVILDVDPSADLSRVEQMVAKIVGGSSVTGRSSAGRFGRIGLLLPEARLVEVRDALARVPEVLWIALEPARRLLNDTTAWVGQTGLDGGQATPLYPAGINGAGQVVAILDTGIDPDMCFFRDSGGPLPPTNECNGGTVVDTLRRKVIAVDFLWSTECAGGISNSEWDTHDHGSHVAGTVAGDDFANVGSRDTADGMAPGAQLVIQDGGFQTNSCADLPGIGCPVVALGPVFQQTYDQGARFHSNSWGDNEDAPVQNNYTAASRDVDDFMWNHPDFLVLFAAGNSGTGNNTVGSPSTNKNGVSVGATNRAASAGSVASFTSCGYTDDLRFKPDFTVPGVSIISANNDINATSNNCGTRTMSGTSMATPGAAGLAALVRQYYADGFYPSGVATVADELDPSAALVKATMLASTRAMESVATPPPSRCQGWGRVTLDDVLAIDDDVRRLIAVDDTVGLAAAGEERVVSFVVTNAAESLRASLAWTDPPSTPAASAHLVQDLDLTAYGPNGETYLGSVWASGQSTTGGSADRVNNVEQIRRAAPTPGIWALRIRAHALPVDDQPWALAVAGAVVPCVFCDGFESSGFTLWSSLVP